MRRWRGLTHADLLTVISLICSGGHGRAEDEDCYSLSSITNINEFGGQKRNRHITEHYNFATSIFLTRNMLLDCYINFIEMKETSCAITSLSGSILSNLTYHII